MEWKQKNYKWECSSAIQLLPTTQKLDFDHQNCKKGGKTLKPEREPGMVMHAYNPSTQETEAEGV
jgi:hypothetical protein